MGTFETPLFLEYIDGYNWRLERTFSYLWDREKVEGRPLFLLTIPAGAETDFCSIPRPLWNILPPTGKYGKAGLCHDHVYRSPGVPLTRAEADQLFLDAMKDLGVGWFTRNLMYRGVRMFGGRAYKARTVPTATSSPHQR